MAQNIFYSLVIIIYCLLQLFVVDVIITPQQVQTQDTYILILRYLVGVCESH